MSLIPRQSMTYYHNYNSNIKFIWLSVISSLIKPWGEITFLLALTCLLYITFTNNLEAVEILKILGLYSAVALKILPSAASAKCFFNLSVSLEKSKGG